MTEPKKRGPKPGSRNNPQGSNKGGDMRVKRITARLTETTHKALTERQGTLADAIEEAVKVAIKNEWS